MALSVKEIDHARPSERDWKLWDEKGLYLLITKSGSRLWQFKYRFLGKEKKLSLGAYPEVPLKTARTKRDEARAMLAEDKDPSSVRRAKKLVAKVQAADTFGAIAREFIAKRKADGLSQTTTSKAEWMLSLLEPRLGRVTVADITAPMLFSVLKEVQDTGRIETGRRLRSFVGRVMTYALITDRAEKNPAVDLQRALIVPAVRHHPAIIDAAQLGALLRAIDSYAGYPSTIGALRLSPHLFQRPGEIRAMRWDELDLEGARWIIPAGRMKQRKEHHVPLSRQASEIIRSMKAVAGEGEHVFPAFHSFKVSISENTVNQALQRLGYGGTMTAHGFRSTASTLLNESGLWSPDVIEHALAHKDPNAVRGIYNRGSYWNARAEMMQWWSDHLDALRLNENQRPEQPKSRSPKRPPARPRKAPDFGRTTADLAEHAR